jgi:hypothetical protein
MTAKSKIIIEDTLTGKKACWGDLLTWCESVPDASYSTLRYKKLSDTIPVVYKEYKIWKVSNHKGGRRGRKF